MCAALAYGYRRKPADLAHLSEEGRFYIDHDMKRRDRAQMLEDMREGDVVRVLYLRDLGGSPKADVIWRERIESRGVTVEEHRPAKRPKPMGRPKKFDPTPEQEARIRAVWLDPTRSLRDRCDAVTDIMGARVARFSLYRRFGSPDKPR